MKKAADLIIAVTDSIIITSVILASTPITQKKRKSQKHRQSNPLVSTQPHSANAIFYDLIC